jgi:rod shape-determining protein MreC
MDKIVSRHKNLWVLAAVLFVQVLALGVQVKRPSDAGSVSLIKIWTVRTITPVQKALVHTTDWVQDIWHSYFYLRGLRTENERLEDENMQLRMEQVRMVQDASQAQRLQALLKFKEQYISETVAAQVIGTSGSETSRVLFVDKGSNDGLRPDMAVITPTGVVGKIMRVFPSTAQVLEINDQTSGVGALLEKSRLQGILKGTAAGDAMLHYIMGDEQVEVGDTVITSGGDRIYPKGLPIGTVVSVNPGNDMFLNIRVKPSARLDRVEEVLVITKISDKEPDLLPENAQRASDILAQRLPSVPVKPPDQVPGAGDTAKAAGTTTAAGGESQKSQPIGSAPSGTTVAKPGAGNNPKPANGAKAKPVSGDQPNVFVNGHGVMHVSDVPNGGAKKPAPKPAQPTTPQR